MDDDAEIYSDDENEEDYNGDDHDHDHDAHRHLEVEISEKTFVPSLWDVDLIYGTPWKPNCVNSGLLKTSHISLLDDEEVQVDAVEDVVKIKDDFDLAIFVVLVREDDVDAEETLNGE